MEVKVLLKVLAVFIATICIAPLLLVLTAWFAPLSPESLESWQHVVNHLLGDYTLTTLGLCLGVAIYSLLFGVVPAWLISRYQFFGQKYFSWLLVLPLAVPAYISAYSYGWLLDYAGPIQSTLREIFAWQREDYWFPSIRSLGGAIVVIGAASTPYVFLLARAAFISQPREWWEAAASMKSSPQNYFWRVSLPAARPFIAMGIALTLMEAIADIGTVAILGVNTISSGIYRSWFYLDEPFIAARLAAVLLLFVFLFLSIESYGRRGLRFSSLRRQPNSELWPLKKSHHIGAFLFCLVTLAVGFLVPVLTLLRLLSYHSGIDWNSVAQFLYHSLRLGLIAGVTTLVAALLLVGAERFYQKWFRHIGTLANLGYAIPGAVVAVGLMILFGWLRAHFSSSIHLTGTILGLIIAYVVRFMATSNSPLQSGLQRVPIEFDMAAASLGKNDWKILWQIHIPLLRLPMLTAFLMVFLDVVKELPATLILRPFDVKPLAVAAFEFASDDRHIEASPYALALILVSAVVVLALHLIQNKSQKEPTNG